MLKPEQPEGKDQESLWKGNASDRSKPTGWRPAILYSSALKLLTSLPSRATPSNIGTSKRQSIFLGVATRVAYKIFLLSESEALGRTRTKGQRGQQGQRPAASPILPLSTDRLIPQPLRATQKLFLSTNADAQAGVKRPFCSSLAQGVARCPGTRLKSQSREPPSRPTARYRGKVRRSQPRAPAESTRWASSQTHLFQAGAVCLC